MTQTPHYDIAAWGVTGTTGQIFAETYARKFGASTPSSPVRIALVGRSQSKLEAVARNLTAVAAEECSDHSLRREAQELHSRGAWAVEIFALTRYGETFSNDVEMLTAICRRASVLAAFAGPFWNCGEAAVCAAAEAGCDYIDITGEVPWVEEMRVKYDAIAKRNKCRIMSCCGFDYLLNDVGLRQLWKLTRSEGPLIEVHQRLTMGHSVMTGGTMRSIVAAMDRCTTRELLCRTKLGGPFSSIRDVPSSPETIRRNKNIGLCPMKSHLLQEWLGMGLFTGPAANYLHWVNSINNWPFQQNLILKVGEGKRNWFGTFLWSFAYGCSLSAMFLASRIPVLQRLIPAPGKGQHREWRTRPDKFVEILTVGQKENGKLGYRLRFVSGEGYAMTAYTALLCAEASIKRRQRGVGPYGVNSPATLLEEDIVEALEKDPNFIAQPI